MAEIRKELLAHPFKSAPIYSPIVKDNLLICLDIDNRHTTIWTEPNNSCEICVKFKLVVSYWTG